jgi:hypothetical protein
VENGDCSSEDTMFHCTGVINDVCEVTDMLISLV